MEPWVKALRRADREESELILSWMAQEREISQAIYDYDSKGGDYSFEHYEGLRELLVSVASGVGIAVRNIKME